MRITEENTTLWDDYQHGLEYQAASGLSKNIPEHVRFYEGHQWARATENTKNLPRPVVNIVKMICRAKKAAIMATPVRIIYRAEDDSADVQIFNNFADYIQKEIGQDDLDSRALSDGTKKGTYIYHYYWDAEATGKNGKKEGGMRCEIIDMLSVFFANPCETDEQKQKWVLIATREDVDSVRAKCDSDVDKDAIVSDDADSKYGTKEQEGNGLVTVLTRYFRQNGEVYCEKATKRVIINKPFAIAPDLDGARKELGLDAPNNSLPDSDKKKPLVPKKARATLYPIVVGNYDEREGSIYGLSEVEGIIPNQKAINFNLAMSLLNAQENAWGKYIVTPKALRGQTITNEPGQTLVDYSETGNGIKRMQEQGFNSQPMQLVDTLTQLTRSVTGSTEVMTGETMGASMSGAAIAQLQAQAQAPIADLKKAFWHAKEKQGRVMLQFFRLFYENKEFSYLPEESAIGGKFGAELTGRKEYAVFSGSAYENTDFDVVVEAVAGTKSSAAGDIQALETLLGKGLISLKTFVRAYPKDALSNKSEILKGIQEDEMGQVAQLTQQAEALQAQLQQYDAQLKQAYTALQNQKATVDNVASIINENTRLKAMIAEIVAEGNQKIAMANQYIAMGKQAANDAVDFAGEIDRLSGHKYSREMHRQQQQQQQQVSNGQPPV